MNFHSLYILSPFIVKTYLIFSKKVGFYFNYSINYIALEIQLKCNMYLLTDSLTPFLTADIK
jgi:hypothetical protein